MSLRIMLLPRRNLARYSLQAFFGLMCFSSGMLFSQWNRMDVIHKCMDPAHRGINELESGFHSGLRHEKTFLLIMVISSPDNTSRRQAMRDTWLKNGTGGLQPKDVKHIFVIGNSELSEQAEAKLHSESKAHKDILLLPLVDLYKSLTEKVLLAMVQLERNIDFKFLMKVDDDSFVRLPALVEELRDTNYPNGLYWGFFDGRAPVFRDKRQKWYEPDYFLCDRYIPYAVGGGYILARDLVEFISNNANSLKLYRSEDVSVGSWLATIRNIHRVHEPRFDTEFRSRGCQNIHLISHKQSEAAMHEKWQHINDKGTLCAKEEHLRDAYNYDWEQPPSKCCQRNPNA